MVGGGILTEPITQTLPSKYLAYNYVVKYNSVMKYFDLLEEVLV